MSLALVIGGTRSGKSEHAERLARATGLPVRYVATADGADPTMEERVRGHRARRPESWTTVQAGARLSNSLLDAAGTCVLIDGLGPWIATALHLAGAFDRPDRELLGRVAGEVLADVDRVALAAERAGAAIVVAEQAGEGVLPPDPVARAWLDMLGEATQRLAVHARCVELVVAGRALTIDAGAAARRDAGAAAPGDASRTPASNGIPALAGLASLRHHGDTDLRPSDADHAVNVIAGGPPAWLRAELREALEQRADRYPDEDDAVAAIAARHGRAVEEVVPTNGAAEALWLLPAALCPALAVCVHPAFTEPEAALRAHGIPVLRVMRDPDRDFALDPGAVPDAADLVVVGNPAAPSGTLGPAGAVLALRRPGRVIVIDEAFMDLVPGEPATLVRDSLEDVIVVRSVTKSLSIPGLRAGYAIAERGLAARLRAVRPPWSANALALAALAAVARRPDEVAAIAERASEERADLAGRLARIDGVRTWPSVTNFCLIEVDDGAAVVDRLRERAIAVRPAASFPGLSSRHIRLTARTPEENAVLVEALEEAIAACS
jgi:histidinol-phosphate/aromatic aminotransferase/cobyric acid decarboxylase-like protein/adenosyl cobinamide kinase/adenosyl cobinamide phosphate guanylyltransferase